MRDKLKALEHALQHGAWWWGAAISLVLLVGSLVLATAVVVGWSADRFKNEPAPFWEQRHPIVRAAGLAAKNLAGALLVILGAIMALPGVPGQGFLTMLIGLTLLDFPGKRNLEKRFISRPTILKAINRLRARFGKPALELEPS
jgi:hypothetical protein